MGQNTRRLADGRVVSVHRNRGVRKVCGCSHRVWAKCPHPWHLNFRWNGTVYRLSLDRYLGRRIESRTDAEGEADSIRSAIRAGTFGAPPPPDPVAQPSPPPVSLTFEAVGSMFVDACRDRGKVSWQDDASMVTTLMSFTPLWPGAEKIGARLVTTVTEQDLEAFLRDLASRGRTAATRNHYVRVFRLLDRWLVRKGYRSTPILSGESDVIRKRKATKRSRRLGPDEESRLLSAAGPHLQRVIICALETSCRIGEILSLQWREVSLKRREILLRADKTKTATSRTIPISARLYAVLDMMKTDTDGEPFGPSVHASGNEIGEQVKDVKRAWQTAVLKAHGHTPTWAWTKGRSKKGSGRLSHESRAAYRAIDLHLHDLRHEAGSRLLEAGWPLHEVQHMLGHTNIEQTSTYLNATLQGLHRSMKALDRTRRRAAKPHQTCSACKPLANEPACDHLADGKDAAPADAKLLVN